MCGPFLARPDDGLHLAVSMQSERTAVAADAALLEPAERRFHLLRDGVDVDGAGAQLSRNAIGPARVFRPDVVDEAIVRVVGHRDDLILVVERYDGHDRPEDLLAHDAHLVVALGEQRWCDEESVVLRRPVTADDELGAVIPAALDV